MPRVRRDSGTRWGGRVVPLVAGVVLLGVALGVAADGFGHRAKPADPAALSRQAPHYRTRWPIKHVIFIIKENRSFDQYFGLFPGARGTTTGKAKTGIVPLQ